MLGAVLCCTFVFIAEGNARYLNQDLDVSTNVLERLTSVEVQLNDQKRENMELRALITELKFQFDSLHAENQKLVDHKHENMELKMLITELKAQSDALKVENQKLVDEKLDNSKLTITLTELKSHVAKLHDENQECQDRTVISENKSQVAKQHVRDQELTDRATVLEERDKAREDLREPVSGLNERQRSKDIPTDNAQKGAMRPIPYISTGGHLKRHQQREGDVNICFFATLVNSIPNNGVNQNIVFENVVTNQGNGYNNHAGDFRAPVAGTYVFSVTLMTYFHHTGHYGIYKGANVVGHLYVRGEETHFETSSMTVVLELVQGEDVSIKNLDLGVGLHGDHYTSFSGFLLAENYSSPIVVG